MSPIDVIKGGEKQMSSQEGFFQKERKKLASLHQTWLAEEGKAKIRMRFIFTYFVIQAHAQTHAHAPTRTTRLGYCRNVIEQEVRIPAPKIPTCLPHLGQRADCSLVGNVRKSKPPPEQYFLPFGLHRKTLTLCGGACC